MSFFEAIDGFETVLGAIFLIWLTAVVIYGLIDYIDQHRHN